MVLRPQQLVVKKEGMGKTKKDANADKTRATPYALKFSLISTLQFKSFHGVLGFWGFGEIGRAHV